MATFDRSLDLRHMMEEWSSKADGDHFRVLDKIINVLRLSRSA